MNQFLDTIGSLPESAQRLANKAMLYTAMSLQNTERQLFANNDPNTSITQTIGGGGALSSMKQGVVNEQTKKFTQTVRLIMERMDRMDRTVIAGYDKAIVMGDGNIDAMIGKSMFLNESDYANKRVQQSRSKTDLGDDYPIELDWQLKRVLVNEAYAHDNEKEYAKNIVVERTTGGMVKIEDHVIAAHVKTLPSWSSYPKLLELYTGIQRPMPQFEGLRQGGGLQAAVQGVDMVMLTQSTHQGDEIYGYRILGFDKVVEHNGQLCYKFFVDQFIG